MDPDSLINNDTVGAIKDNPIASSNPETTNKIDEKITANLCSAKISLVNENNNILSKNTTMLNNKKQNKKGKYDIINN